MASKQPGKEIGDFAQFAKFGGAKPTSTPAAPIHQSQEREEQTARHTPLAREKTTSDSKNVRLVIYVDPDLAKWVKHKAVDNDQSITDVVVEWLEEIRAREI